MNELTLYHGSQKIIRTPVFGEGNPRNDYGLGFYCTESLELAKEWACTEESSGYANAYHFDMTDLSVLNFSGEEYNILSWLSILLQNRISKYRMTLLPKAKTTCWSVFCRIIRSSMSSSAIAPTIRIFRLPTLF